MSTATVSTAAFQTGAAVPQGTHRWARVGLLTGLQRPGQLFENITPNWFASVMGTGIVANAAATLPVHVPGLHTFAVAVWVFATSALVLLGGAFAVYWTRHRQAARAHAAHPVMSQFYGAPPMAMLTVGAGALLLGKNLIGLPGALTVDWVLWTAGTLTGLATSLWIPYRMITAHDHGTVAALPAWLMPIVPPMVSASTGAAAAPRRRRTAALVPPACLLRDVRSESGPRTGHHHIDLLPPRARGSACGTGCTHRVDHARHDRPVDHRGEPARRRSQPGHRSSLRQRAAGLRPPLRRVHGRVRGRSSSRSPQP